MNWKDNFTYTDLSGKRRLRNYVKAAILILILLAGVFAYGAYKRQAFLAEINATPVIVATKLALTATATDTVEPSPTPITPTPTATPDPCPTDPYSWEFPQPYAGMNMAYRRLTPDCVVERMLGRTIAWYNLWMYMGYTKQEATELLGFTEPPEFIEWGWVTIPTAGGEGKIKVNLQRFSNIPFRLWAVPDDNQYGIGLFLNGCWGTNNDTFIVLCIAYEDGWRDHVATVWQFGDVVSTTPTSSGNKIERYTQLFGYLRNEHRWVYMGQGKETQTVESWEKALNNRDAATTVYGWHFWDPLWVEKAYGLKPKDLPENWQQYTDPAYREALTKAMQDYIDAQKAGTKTPD